MSISKFQALYRRKDITAVSLLDHFYTETLPKDADISSVISHTKTVAYEIAREVDKRRERGDALPPLAGVPIGIKDNIHIAGERTTCGSKMLQNFVAPYDATVIKKCKDSLLLPVVKLNMDEFAMGSSTENSAFFPTKNPRNITRVPGGSSGGSAAAVAAGLLPITLGSDTGGSIRQPAAFCGVTGLKPTYGRVSRYGLVAFASSLDQIGPIATTAAECAAVLDVISGFDPKDATSANRAFVPLSELKPSQKSLRIGVPKELMGKEIDPEVRACVESAIAWYEKKGHHITWITMPSFSAAVATYYIIAPAEASSNLARYDGVRYGYRAEKTGSLREMMAKSRGYGFGPEVKRRIVLGTYVLSAGYYDAFYGKAQAVRQMITQDFQTAFCDVDVLLTPTTPTVAFPLGAHSSDPLSMYLADIATIPVNMAGLPALSLPCGISEGLPVGMQLIGRHFDEQTLLELAHQFQLETTHHLSERAVS